MKLKDYKGTRKRQMLTMIETKKFVFSDRMLKKEETPLVDTGTFNLPIYVQIKTVFSGRII